MKCRGGPYARRGGSAYPPASYGLSARQIYLGMQRAAQRPLRADTQIRPYGGNGDLTWMARPLRAGTRPAPAFRRGMSKWTPCTTLTDVPIRPCGNCGFAIRIFRSARSYPPGRRKLCFGRPRAMRIFVFDMVRFVSDSDLFDPLSDDLRFADRTPIGVVESAYA